MKQKILGTGCCEKNHASVEGEQCNPNDLQKVQQILDQLKINGYKLTSQRSYLIEILCRFQDRFLKVEDLYDLVKAVHQGVNLTTIYRNLEALEDIGVVHRTLFDNQTAYFKLTCHHHHHHHMICTTCGKMTVIDFCPLETLKKMAKQEHFVIEGHKLEVFGRCANCQSKSE